MLPFLELMNVTAIKEYGIDEQFEFQLRFT